ncbi:IS1380 family transposase [Micromonospora sp. NBC_00898]|uniref:IS1380 family transposase n=1 Tax=Micromonospora sp. NBC_00898 TaxID=2975981 RepID=UPI00386A87E0|nr:IS1380 family transposase [Micromonospora sp. NBC_00898]WSX86979.1 IS1380 family transposase [Micromonospora sp. NBC_00898]WSX86980.1 IS1380 family transposase [Micromonospora sp. NBC_00898]WSX87642.1 IS1380 family transposase [Micromonospora sp. NBC_00898]WSX87748.1 IS1380 family transposase [Micromonospora sp. NBC_00898]
MQGSHAWRGDGAVFDDDNLVSHAGLVPLLELAEQAGLSRLLDEHVRFVDERVKSGAANSTPKLTSIIAGMAAGADSIDDLDVIRSGGMKELFGGVYANATLGIFLREFTHGHTRQLSAVLRRHLVALAKRTPVLAGIGDRVFIDIDSLLRPVYGHAKQGASFGHTKVAGKSILRRGLSPLAVTISTETAAPVVAGVRLRAGRAGSAKGAASMVTEAINTATDAGAQAGNILVRGDSAYCSGKVIAAVVKAGANFSFAIARNPAVDAAIATIPDEAYTPVHYPGAVTDPDTGELISDAQVSEVEFTAFAGTRHEITGWLVVRRVLDANTQDPLFPVWRYHPFFTNNTEPAPEADITHRRHAVCETVWSDLIDGPWAHQPSGSFPANAAWNILAAITHNLLRAAGTLTATRRYAVARGATLRTHLINVAARLARPQRRPVLHLPTHWPRAAAWLTFWKAVFTT